VSIAEPHITIKGLLGFIYPIPSCLEPFFALFVLLALLALGSFELL
jgi:hypothetical protein